MKLVTFTRAGRTAPGVWLDGGVAELPFASMLELVRAGPAALDAIRQLSTDRLVPHADVQLEAPIGLARNAFCVGRNYKEHVEEGFRVRGTEVKLPTVPQFFTKATHTLNRPGGEVRLDPTLTRLLDYEVELALVIGKGGRDIAPEAAFDHIFGYTIANDVTARDLQRAHEQWFKGKSLDTTLPLGPWIVTADEIGDPTMLELSLTVNGEERQRAKVSMMIFDIPTIIASLSRGLTLEPGDVIATGTPSGVGYAMDPPQRLKDGDVMVCTIDRIGRLENRVVEV